MSRLRLWLAAAAGAALTYPLLRFTGYTVKAKPRHILIKQVIAVGKNYTDHDFILFVFQNGPVAVSRRCTHLGCRVNYRQELDLIECPCHQSRFTTHGVLISGPAQKNLPTFPVKVLTDENGMTTGYEVTI